jgi:hypothetical protein
MTRPVLLLLVLSLLPAAAPATAAAGTCRKSCATLQANCLDAARGVLSDARVACAGERPCRREALRAFRGERSTCRKARAQCRPCCVLGGVNECARRAGAVLPAEPQAAGDPVRGRDLLLGGDYMTCGVPYKVWSLGKDLVAGGYGGSADAPRIAVAHDPRRLRQVRRREAEGDREEGERQARVPGEGREDRRLLGAERLRRQGRVEVHARLHEGGRVRELGDGLRGPCRLLHVAGRRKSS